MKAGQELGPHRLVHQLGEGAYAQVWLAEQRGEHGFSKKVALKILKETATDADAFESLLDEARLGGMLHHRHVVDVYGISQIDGRTFIAMEYVDGATLSDVLGQTTQDGVQLPLSVIVDVVLGIAQALDHAHNAKGPDGEKLRVVHRDLKPGNVMLASGVGVKVTDFGLAKATTNQNVTQAGQVRGTPGYIAPEVWAGTRDFTPAVDLWALGVMIWEMAVGDRLFSGGVFEVMSQAMNGDLEPAFGRLTAARPELTPLVRQLLVREPATRCQSAWEVVEALEALKRRLDLPGGLELFLELVGVQRAENRRGAEALMGRATASDDPAWSQLINTSELSSTDREQLRVARQTARKEREALAQERASGAETAFQTPRPKLPLEIILGIVVVILGIGLLGWSALQQKERGCVVFQSEPTGKQVTVDGEPTSLLTGSAVSSAEYPAGTIAVTMGDGPQTASVAVLVEAGRRTVVWCTLDGSGACTLSAEDGRCE